MAASTSHGKHWTTACCVVRGFLVYCRICRMVSCVMECTQLHVLYAGGKGVADTLGSGVVVGVGAQLGSYRIIVTDTEVLFVV